MEGDGYVDPVTGLSQEQWNKESRAAVERFLGSLPDASGTFGGHLVIDACYAPGGCGPDCPVWIGEAEDARGPN
jgi:hypothetical protein